MYVADRLKNAKHPPTVTLAFVIVFVTTYAAQLLLVGSLSQDAGFQAATIVKNVVGSGSVVFSWLFHSTHTHLLQNLAVFVLTGWWVESRVDRDRFILGIAAVLGIGANVTAVVLFQTPGAGISGITTGLVTMVALGNFEGLLNAGSHLLRIVVVFTLSTCLLLWSVGAITQLPAGTAVEIHLLGGVFGAGWYATEKLRYEFSHTLN